MLSHAIFWKEIHVEILWDWEKTYVLYNKTRTQWTTWVAKDTLSFGEGGNKRNHVYGNPFVLCSKRKPPRKLRDWTCFSNCGFRVQPHAIYGSGLVNYIGKTHALSSGYWTWGPGILHGYWRQASNGVWEDPLERLRHILNLPELHLVSTYPAATGGVKTRLCHVGKVYNFCRR